MLRQQWARKITVIHAGYGNDLAVPKPQPSPATSWLVTNCTETLKTGRFHETRGNYLSAANLLFHFSRRREQKEEILEEEIEQLIAERQEARKEKNFARADEIRDILKEKGYVLKDTPQGVQIIKE